MNAYWFNSFLKEDEFKQVDELHAQTALKMLCFIK